MKLISMTDLVLKVVQTPNINEAICWEQTESRLNKIYEYALLLKQPLTLGMLVPCDLKGNVLKEDYRDEEGDNQELHLFNKKTYREAKSRVLFKGFVYVKDQKTALLKDIKLSVSPYTDTRLYITHKMNGSFHTWFDLHTIEDLVKCNLELSESVIKKLGL